MRKIKNKIRKLWKLWCLKVDIHNEKLEDSWVTCDEVWSPYFIFIPLVTFFIGLIFGLVVTGGDIGCGLAVAFLSTIFIISCMYMNWISYK